MVLATRVAEWQRALALSPFSPASVQTRWPHLGATVVSRAVGMGRMGLLWDPALLRRLRDGTWAKPMRKLQER
eukprot:3380297-Alexandrium_andersonii.AAC.1